MGDDGALRFAERLIALVDAGRKSATYKLATLLALIDLTVEGTTPAGGPPGVLSGREVARRVIELYWPQTVIYGVGPAGQPTPLRQSPQNDIPAKLASWRARHHLPAGAPLSDARAVDPSGWDDLEADLVAVVIGMPLAKLQRFGDGRSALEDRFIYQFAWRDEVKRPTVNRPRFDDRIHLNPGVAEWLVQLAPLLRPLIQAKWADLVARQNPDLVDRQRLDDFFLFGATRISLERIRQPLLELQRGSCFYCREPVRRPHIDHFLPWSRHPDNHLDNLVAAHAACNNAKSASIASHRHLDSWAARVGDPDVDAVAAATGWPRRRDRTAGAVNGTYLSLPGEARLWVSGRDYEPADPQRIRTTLLTVG